MEDISELFSELSISLFGQPVTATDILTAEIKPHFGEQCLPSGIRNSFTSHSAQWGIQSTFIILCETIQAISLAAVLEALQNPAAIRDRGLSMSFDQGGVCCSGAKLPGVVRGLEGTCGLAEASLSSMSLGPRPVGSPRAARDQAQASASGCGSIGGTSAVPSSGQARQALRMLSCHACSAAFETCPGAGMLSATEVGKYRHQIRQGRLHALLRPGHASLCMLYELRYLKRHVMYKIEKPFCYGLIYESY